MQFKYYSKYIFSPAVIKCVHNTHVLILFDRRQWLQFHLSSTYIRQSARHFKSDGFQSQGSDLRGQGYCEQPFEIQYLYVMYGIQ